MIILPFTLVETGWDGGVRGEGLANHKGWGANRQDLVSPLFGEQASKVKRGIGINRSGSP